MARPAAGVAKAPAAHAVSAPAPLQPAAAVKFVEAPVQLADAAKSVVLKCVALTQVKRVEAERPVRLHPRGLRATCVCAGPEQLLAEKCRRVTKSARATMQSTVKRAPSVRNRGMLAAPKCSKIKDAPREVTRSCEGIFEEMGHHD